MQAVGRNLLTQLVIPSGRRYGRFQKRLRIAMDPEAGMSLAVGGRTNEKHTFRGFNRGNTAAERSGVTFKPLAVYTPALEGYS